MLYVVSMSTESGRDRGQPERFTRFLAGFKTDKEPKHWIDRI